MSFPKGTRLNPAKLPLTDEARTLLRKVVAVHSLTRAVAMSGISPETLKDAMSGGGVTRKSFERIEAFLVPFRPPPTRREAS